MESPNRTGPARSLWTETAPPSPATAPLSGTVQADVAIIGGGYSGLSAAHSLAEAGLSAVVLEARELGYGGSGRNGGVVSAKFRVGLAAIEARHGRGAARRMHAIAHESVEMVERLVERYAIGAAEYRRSGALKCVHNAAAFAGLRDGPVDSPRAFQSLRRAMTGIFPELRDSAIDHRWSGYVALTLNALPRCGRLDERIVYAVGYNGAGVAMASLLGARAADIARGETPDLSLLRQDRLRPVPLYPLRAAAVRAATAWNEAMDALGR